MRRSVYLAIAEQVEAQQVWDFAAIVAHLQSTFPEESSRSLRHIVAQLYVQRAKSTFPRLRYPRRRNDLYREVRHRMAPRDGEKRPTGALCEVARDRNCAPALVARLVIEEYLREGREEDADVSKVRRTSLVLS